MKTVQREMPWLMPLDRAKWVPAEIVSGWQSYREAVLWCWAHRPHRGLNEPDDQALFSRNAGLHAPHMSRCVNPHTRAPMDLKADLIPFLEAYTGWRGVTQYLARKAEVHVLEEMAAKVA